MSLYALKIVFINTIFILSIHLFISYYCIHFLDLKSILNFRVFHNFGFENFIYRNVFILRRWKKYLPDGAALFKQGFRKHKILSHQRVYLENFRQETYRAEFAHLLQLIALIFYTWLSRYWNTENARLGLYGYALLSNLPCLIVQRYNRIVFTRLLKSQNKNPDRKRNT